MALTVSCRLCLQAGVLFILAAMVSSLALSEAPVEAVARFNLKGITGYVRLETINETTTRVSANVQGLPLEVRVNDSFVKVFSGLNWHIHQYPVDLTLNPDYRCLNDYVGGHYDPFSAQDNPDYDTDCSRNNLTLCEVGDLTGKFGQITEDPATYYDTSGELQLGGRYGVVGRSIVIHAGDGSNFACTTIRSIAEDDQDAQVVTLSSTFIAPMGGVIYLRQVNNEHVNIFGKLFWVNGVPSSIDHNWHIHEDVPSIEYRDGTCAVGPHFDPFERPPPSSPNYFCSPDPENITNCEVGDLTGKHDVIDVSANPLPYQEAAFFFTDSFLNLSTSFLNSVSSRSIAIHAADRGVPIVACAPLVPTEVRMVSQYPDGQLEILQDSPYEETTISSNYTSLYHLDILPEVLNTNDLCAAYSSIYDPFNATDVYEQVTLDARPIGALYTKYSSYLENPGSFDTTEVPVHGVDTVTSRTLQAVLSNSRTTCSTLTPPMTNSTVVAVATYVGDPIEGNIIFIQDVESDVTPGMTNIIVDLHYTDSSQSSTSGHNWHVHQRPPVDDESCVDAIGPHYNPFEVSLDNANPNSNYSEDCGRFSPLRCESGDMSGKHGQLQIDPIGPETITFSYLDPSLYLTGPYSIVGRSIGIHAPNGGAPILYCAEIRYVNLSTLSISLSRPETFNRVEFLNTITERAGVMGQSLLLKQIDVGSRSSEGATCVDMTFNTLVDGGTLQSTLCDMYEDDPCLRSWPDYSDVCGAAATISLSLFSLLVAVIIALYV